MKKNYVMLALVSVVLFSACSKDEDQYQGHNQSGQELFLKDTLSKAAINSRIDQISNETGSFHWKDGSYQMLWSAIISGNNMVTIGFGENADDFDSHKSAKGDAIKTRLKNIVLESEKVPARDLIFKEDSDLNIIEVVIKKRETLEALLKEQQIRYIEPANYRYFDGIEARPVYGAEVSSSSGCGFSSATISSADYTTVTPNARVPWNFYKHNIPGAWNYSTGSGVTIGVVDTGLSPQQSLMNGSFNSGSSSGRTVQRFGVYVDSIWPWSSGFDGPDDQCGHGTSMASVATAPRNNSGLPVGVAYNANLITYRAASNVVLDGYHEQEGVKLAFTALGNNNSVKIISMSMGHIISVGKIEDGVRYAYSKGKLIFCAGGTSTSFTNFAGVIFPASMSEAVAVTGVKEGTTFQECDVCHKGGKIDFTIVMERSGTNNNVPVLSYYNNAANYVGGSSVATATTAGIAALVWAKNPGWTRDQVLTKMKQSSTFYPTKNANFGHGNINAQLAVQ